MKVKELIDILNRCNPNADVTPIECKLFQKEHYYPITLEYIKVDHYSMHQDESTHKEANVVLIHWGDNKYGLSR